MLCEGCKNLFSQHATQIEMNRQCRLATSKQATVLRHPLSVPFDREGLRETRPFTPFIGDNPPFCRKVCMPDRRLFFLHYLEPRLEVYFCPDLGLQKKRKGTPFFLLPPSPRDKDESDGDLTFFL